MSEQAQASGSGILLATALTNPETYGFKWVIGEVSGDNGKKPLGKIPLIEWTSTTLAQKAFGESFMLELVNGSQSIRVRIQNKLRPMIEAGDVKRDDVKAMKVLVVEEVLQGSTRRVRTQTVERFTDIAGVSHDTKDAADKANSAIMLERSQASIARLVDKGLSYDEAIEALGLRTEAPQAATQ